MAAGGRDSGLIACLDVYYRHDSARGACVLIDSWTSTEPVAEFTMDFEEAAPYQPGEFYRRELPLLLELLKRAEQDGHHVAAVVVDGFVWLGDETKPGLGGHLYEQLGREIPVVGVAKNPLAIAKPVREIFRGQSRQPLLVSAAGLEPSTAGDLIRQMAGNYRHPSVLKRADRLSRLR